MWVEPTPSMSRLVRGGQSYYFCTARCRQKFEADPGRYLAQAAPVADGEGNVLYTCPMHPEIRHWGPGLCPICGMALEPLVATAEAPADLELRSMSRRFWVSAVLSVPLLAMGMAEMRFAGAGYVELALASPVVLWGAAPLFQRFWRSLLNLHANMFTLIGMGVGVSYGYSLAALLAPQFFPPSFRMADGGVPLYFEPAAVITTLVLLGQVLELRARGRTGAAIRGLLDLAPKTARRLRADGGEEEVPVAVLRPGDVLRLRPGEGVPTDGVVIEGHSAVNEAMVTGESIPVEKNPGDSLVGATLNGTGSLVMRAERVGAETMLARIVQMVSEAQRSKAPLQRLADRVSGYFVPAVIGVAVLTFGVWAFVGPQPRLVYGLVNAVAVLIVACPCALGLATPMAVMVGLGRGATVGVLVKNAAALETLSRADVLLLDKTGTLTTGHPQLTDCEIVGADGIPGLDERALLRLTASLERASEHPLAQAIVGGAERRGLALAPVNDFRSVTGQGAMAQIEGRRVLAGNAQLLTSHGIDAGPLLGPAERRRRDGQTVVMVAVDGRPAGLLAVADPIKDGAREAISALRTAGLTVRMVTGDHRTTAEAVAAKLGIDGVDAEVPPEGKGEVVSRLQAQGHVVAMAGDGINDAPALARADVGVAMGTGTDIAMESAGLTLIKGDLRGLLRARKLSLATVRNIKQNLFFAFAYNLVGIPVAAGVLYPFFGILLGPMIAGAAMSLSSVSVIVNALRLRKVRLA
jgi:Cu+-exporting ATPase